MEYPLAFTFESSIRRRFSRWRWKLSIKGIYVNGMINFWSLSTCYTWTWIDLPSCKASCKASGEHCRPKVDVLSKSLELTGWNLPRNMLIHMMNQQKQGEGGTGSGHLVAYLWRAGKHVAWARFELMFWMFGGTSGRCTNPTGTRYQRGPLLLPWVATSFRMVQFCVPRLSKPWYTSNNCFLDWYTNWWLAVPSRKSV